jgi:hypothetical protein
MTKKQKVVYRYLKDKMKSLEKSDNIEASHRKADDILCEMLETLGYKKIVSLYYNIDKWYG